MKSILQKLFAQQTLERSEASDALHSIVRGEANHSQIASFLTVFLMRPVRVEELEGFRDALLELCLPVDLGSHQCIDLCGTGGDEKNTFNISTAASFIVAGAGYKVAKHGNYGVSSVSGSSNLLDYFGYRFSNDLDVLKKQFDDCNICFLHAPLFHPAMKSVASIRQDLGIKTFFNMLGPLVNPARPKFQLTGVFNLELARIYQYLLQQTGSHFTIVHSLDGYDEVSLTSAFKLIDKTGERLCDASHFFFTELQPQDLFGGETVKSSAEIFINVLKGMSTSAQRNVVLANAALAIKTIDENLTIKDALQKAEASLDSHLAYNTFNKLIASS